MMRNMSKFSERVRSLRQEKNLSLRQLAALTGISHSAISSYENGRREPSFKSLEALAIIFNVDMNYLLGKTDMKNREEVYWAELQENIRIAYNHICTSMSCEKIAEAICCLQHGFIWIDELPGRPSEWDKMDVERQGFVRSQLIEAAKITIGEKAVDRYYWQNVRGRSEQEFEDFWQSGHFNLLYKNTNETGDYRYDCDGQRNNGCKAQKTILSFLFGFAFGSLIGNLLILLLKIIGVL